MSTFNFDNVILKVNPVGMTLVLTPFDGQVQERLVLSWDEETNVAVIDRSFDTDTENEPYSMILKGTKQAFVDPISEKAEDADL